MMIAGFLIFRVLLLRILMKPPTDDLTLSKKGTKPERLLNIGSVLYSICHELFTKAIKIEPRERTLLRKDS